MVYLKQQRPEKVTVPAVRQSKERGERLVCLTAYDYPTARIVDEAGTDIILVGDSLGNVVLGYDSTVPVTLEEMLHHTRAVRRGVERALLVADMPYGSYHTGEDEAVRAVTEALHVPTIGIGAGAGCDAQILVTHDLLGLSFSRTSPRFVRQYANLRDSIADAVTRYADDVRAGAFPSDAESYPLPADAAAELGLMRAGDEEAKKP